MKVELIHPPHENSTDDRLDPPLGLLLIAAYVREQHPGVEIRVNDLSGHFSPDSWEIHPADLYGLTVYCPSVAICGTIIKRCREVSTSAKIVAGGAFPSALPAFLRDITDHVVVGDGEIPLSMILSGVRYPVIEGRPAPPLFPAYDLVDLKSYSRTIAGLPSVPYLVSRGCPYQCSFCGLHHLHSLSPIRFTPISTVVDHLKRLSRMWARTINFQDDIFTLHPQLYQILATLKSLNLRFRCMGRAGLDSEATYKALAHAGCAQISWGIESGSQTILDRMNKRCTVQDNHNVIRWAKDHSINTRAFFVIGFPGETAETLEETKAFIERADPDQIFVSSFVPYPGTPVWNDPKRFGITRLSHDFSNYLQVNRLHQGSVNIDTKFCSAEEMLRLQNSFRQWTTARPMRGHLQNYEQTTTGGNDERAA